MLVAMMLEDMLTELGCDVVRAARVAKAFHLIATAQIDCAILDINVAGDPVYPVANELQGRRIPFIFSSGYGAAGLPPEYRNYPTLSKPLREEELALMLADAIQRGHR
jgi:CheY-like chemotaxis protein